MKSKVTAAVIFIFSALSMGCGAGEQTDGQRGDGQHPHQSRASEGLHLFRPVIGIDFHEVRRTFDTGISYDSTGFVQVPEWHLRFAAEDSVLIYSPDADRMLGYKMYHDHEDYFHFARESWRVIELHPDSITLQALSLKGLKVDRFKSNIYMKFYAAGYIEELVAEPRLSFDEKIEHLRRPTRQDSAFVWKQIERANRYPDQPDSAFASRHYAQLESRHSALSIRKKTTEQSLLNGVTPSYEYLYPEYVIRIEGAYRDFSHDFSVVVDENGQMHLGKIFVNEKLVDPQVRTVQGIIDVYLHHWLRITPAHTFGIPHASTVYLNVRGKAAP